ncbi:MAG TPA: ATP-binding protein [Aggregatilineales bacterium]|nr:ATP-binding protein [Aggregatilineales bacterium]
MTIRTRLTLWYSSLLATLIVVFGISLFAILNYTWNNQVEENMLFVAQQTVANITENPTSGQIELQAPEALDMITYPYLVQVRRADGTLVTSTSGRLDPFDSDMLKSQDRVVREVMVGKIHALVMTQPLKSDHNGAIVGTVQILSSLTTIDTATERLFRIMLGVGLVALLMSFMVGSVIAGQALQPIDTISQAAKEITASGDLSKRVPYHGPPDELGQLTATFNATLGRLERLFLTQRRFVADVSHELRTPLTTVQGNLDLIKRWGNDPTSLEAIDGEVKRMSRLVGDLLLLAQADSGRLPLVEASVELSAVAFDVFRQAQVLATEVELRLGSIEAVHVLGDEDRLRQLLLNLVTNAIKYTPAGGHVIISVTQNEGFAFIRVSDTGIGIPEEDLAHIFDRFYRVDKARSREMGGTGLGLSIASWITEAHKGRIWAESEVGKGSVFTVRLPSLDKAEPTESLAETRPRISVPGIRRRSRSGIAEVKDNRDSKIGKEPVVDKAAPDATPEIADFSDLPPVQADPKNPDGDTPGKLRPKPSPDG